MEVSKKLEAEPEFMRAAREEQQDRLLDLALYLNHRITLTDSQRRRAKARAAAEIKARQEARTRENRIENRFRLRRILKTPTFSVGSH